MVVPLQHNDVNILVEDFIRFFLEKPEKIRSDIAESLASSTLALHRSNIFEPSVSSLGSLTCFTPMSHIKALKLLVQSPFKSSDVDTLPTWILLRCRDAFISAITMILNSAIEYGMPSFSYEDFINPTHTGTCLPFHVFLHRSRNHSLVISEILHARRSESKVNITS
jgi:hypothetical protein